MSRSRTQRSDSEFDQLDRLKKENKKLKQQLSRLRKTLSRVDLDRFENLKNLLDSQDKQDVEEAAKDRDISTSNQWECWDCKEVPRGTLRLVVIERLHDAIYNRVCDQCGKKTKFQKYNEKVKGIKRDDQDPPKSNLFKR